uniref:Zinc finger, CCHC-type n=1 Tax=Tanacetum cinerariifolium TaxID=118510 RepID=A0A6L2LYK7_TANCI|nr:zinc finger, CCHC-type [Tanacetum cinerariifolium]
MTSHLWVDGVISVKGVPWVGDGGVSGVSLSVVSSVDDKNGEIAGNSGIWSDDGSSDGLDSISDACRIVGKTVGISVGVTVVSIRVVGGEMVGMVSGIMGKNVPAFILIFPSDQASNCLERLPAGSITTWEDLTTRFLAHFFPPGRTAKLHNDILMFQQHHEESLFEFEADFKQQQSEMTNKIDTALKAIIDRMADPQCSNQTHGLINAITIHTEQQSASYNDEEKENKEKEDDPKNIHVNPPTPLDPSKKVKFNSFFESLGLVPPSSNTELICTKEEDGDVMFIEIVLKDDNSHKEEPKVGEQEVEYFDIFLTKSELAYHKYLMCSLIPSIFYETLSLWKDALRTSRYHTTLGMCM